MIEPAVGQEMQGLADRLRVAADGGAVSGVRSYFVHAAAVTDRLAFDFIGCIAIKGDRRAAPTGFAVP